MLLLLSLIVSYCDGINALAGLTCPLVMWSRRLGATDATEIVRRGKRTSSVGGRFVNSLFLSARDSIWINPGFHEQLVLFQVCQYNPHPGDGVYASWKTKVDRKLKAAGLC